MMLPNIEQAIDMIFTFVSPKCANSSRSGHNKMYIRAVAATTAGRLINRFALPHEVLVNASSAEISCIL